MSLVVTCACGRSFRAKPELAGKRVKCPACSAVIQVPGQSAAKAGPPPEAPAPPAPSVDDDPLGLGNFNDQLTGTPLLPASGRLPRAGAASVKPKTQPKTKRNTDWRPIVRIGLIVGGVVAGLAVLAIAGFFLWPLVMGGQSPEAVFETAKAKSQARDWEGFCDCLTPESQDAMAGMMLASVVMLKEMSGMAALGGSERLKEAQQQLTAVTAVLDKHGLTDEKLKELRGAAPGMPLREPDRVKQMLAPVKNRGQFIADMLRTMMQLGNRAETAPLEADAVLENVQISGDTATASLKQTRDGTQRSETMNFKRVNGVWKIALPQM